MPDKQMTEFLHGVVGVVEANSYETMCLWKEYAEELKKPWKQRCDGLGEIVGKLADMPVFLSLLTAEIEGHKILFIDATSQVIDHRLIDQWLANTLPTSAFRGGDPRNGVNKTDAMNFSNVFPRKAKAA